MTTTSRIFGIYELAESILLQLSCIKEIIRAQRVCRSWKDIVRTSPALREACWYQRRDGGGACEQPNGRQTWKLNPVFNQIGVLLQPGSGETQENGQFDLEKQIYDEPGSWTTMLATQPPCRRMEVACYGDYSADDTMHYLIESRTNSLLLGDVMAILAECQNRQRRGVDRWAGVTHDFGRVFPGIDEEWYGGECISILENMPDDVSINVAVCQAWGSGDFPAFSLRRLCPLDGTDGCLSGGSRFLHELIVRRMVNGGHEYKWEGRSYYGEKQQQDGHKAGGYQAKLLAVARYEDGYLSDCRDIFRLVDR